MPLPRDAADAKCSISAGDLDEAIQTIIGLSDETSTDDVHGGLFEKIDAFRDGVVNGLDSCLDDLCGLDLRLATPGVRHSNV